MASEPYRIAFESESKICGGKNRQNWFLSSGRKQVGVPEGKTFWPVLGQVSTTGLSRPVGCLSVQCPLFG